MFNPWNTANFGNARQQSSRFPNTPQWPQLYPQSNWFNPSGFNFDMLPHMSMPNSFAPGGLPGFVPQAQPPPPPPNTAPPPEPSSTNTQPPPPPGHPTGVASPRTMDYEKEWQKYQESLQAEPTQHQTTGHVATATNLQLKEIIEEEKKFNEQYVEWKKQCDAWKEMNKSHPDQDLFQEYGKQWKIYETQMNEKQNDIRQRKEQIMKSLQPAAPPPPPQSSRTHFSLTQSSASFSSWRMPEKSHFSQPQLNVSNPGQNWNRPGGKGEQVNFGQDINQRFQSTGQQNWQQDKPQNEPRQAWPRPQRPLLDNPIESQGPTGFVPRHQGNRFPTNQSHNSGSRMTNLRFRPPEPNSSQHQPWPRSMPGPGRPAAPRLPMPQEVPGGRGPRDAKVEFPLRSPSLLGAPPQSRPPHPLLSDPSSNQGKRSFEETAARPPVMPRRPLLFPQARDFEHDQKRMRFNAPENEPRFNQQQSPQKRFQHPTFSPRPQQMPGPSEVQPRLQMMGPRFRRQGAAAVSQEFQNRTCEQTNARLPPPQIHQQQRDSGSFESHGLNNEHSKVDTQDDEKTPAAVGKKSPNAEENAREDALPDKSLASSDESKVVEGDKLAASSPNATNYRPTDPKPVGESQTDDSNSSPNKVSEIPVETGTEIPHVPQGCHGGGVSQSPSEGGGVPVTEQRWNIGTDDGGSQSFVVADEWTGGSEADPHPRKEPEAGEEKPAVGEGGKVQPDRWESDRDWREGGWSDDWSKEPIVHDYRHRCSQFQKEDVPSVEDRDERYPPPMFHHPGNPYVATVIDYGHGGVEQEPHPNDSRGYPAPVPPVVNEEMVFKHDQDFRTPLFYNCSPEFAPVPILGLPPTGHLRVPPRSEDPVMEKIPIETLLLPPGRAFRPDHVVVMVRGLPGAGKTYISKLIKEREIKEGGTAPRLLCLDDYFITEVEKVIEDPDTGKKVKKMVMEYEYDRELEATYKASFVKSFRKHVDDLFFSFIIVDATFDKKLYMDEFWNYAKSKGFQVYVIEVEADVVTCAKRNDHQRTLADIQKIKDGWDETPRHYLQLDAQFLLQGNIEEVEMDNSSAILEADVGVQNQEDREDANESGYQKSRWELDTSEQHLDKLDGLKTPKKVMTLEEYLQVPEDYEERSSVPGKKRVRWADIEEKKGVERMRKLGFVVGYTDWDKLKDDSCIEKALIKTKYI